MYVSEYGTYINPFLEKNNTCTIKFKKFFPFLEEFKFHLIVSRLEPENNVEMILKAYENSTKKIPMVIVGKLNTKESKKLIRYKSKNIFFLDGIYEKENFNC